MADEHQTETYRSMITVSLEFFKALQYLNGGAMGAILAYLTQAREAAQLAPHAKCPISLFGLGLFSGTTCFGTSYLTQFALFNEGLGRHGPLRFGHMVWVV